MGVHRPRRGLIPRRNWAALVCEAVGYGGKTTWDTSRPDGQPVRYLDVSKARERIGFAARAAQIAEGADIAPETLYAHAERCAAAA